MTFYLPLQPSFSKKTEVVEARLDFCFVLLDTDPIDFSVGEHRTKSAAMGKGGEGSLRRFEP